MPRLRCGLYLGCALVGERDGFGGLRGLRLEQDRGEHGAGGGDRGEHVEGGLEAVDQRGAAERARARVGADEWAVSVVATVVATATPIAPPTCWVVLISPDATPASAGRTPVSAPIDIGTNASARPRPLIRKAGKRSEK